MTRSRLLSVVMLPLTIGAGWAGSPAFSKEKPVLSLRAFAVDTSGVGRTQAGTLDITIERWSTDAERQRLLDVLIEKGSAALLSALQKIEPRAGYIRTSTSLGWDIHYAREEPFGDGGRRVVIATDRPMSFWELRNRPRSADYDFTLAEIRLPKDGKGVGKLATAAKVTWHPETRTIEIENFGIEPVRLTEVRVEGAKPR